MRRLLVAALLLFVVVVLFRVMFGAPLVRRVMETFTGSSASSLLNVATECPSGSQMYIYDGVVYCCNGTVNPDADTVERSCKPLLFGGPSQKIPCNFCSCRRPI